MKKNELIILSSDQLRSYMQQYRVLVSPSINDYLNSLIGLEISALNQNAVSDTTMAILNKLDLYRKIVIYNIYNRTLNVLKNFENEFCFENRPQSLSIFSKDQTNIKHDVFNYWMHENGVSNIVLKQTIIDESKRQEQIDRLRQKLEEVKSTKKTLGIIQRKFFYDERTIKIRNLSDLIEKLESRSVLDSNVRMVSESENDFINQLLGNDGLQVTGDFMEEQPSSQSDSEMHLESINTYSRDIERELTKKLVKTYPHTLISKTIKYY